eukprot:scaffold204119_cov26-Tisochrysis_lutea.AAC.1
MWPSRLDSTIARFKCANPVRAALGSSLWLTRATRRTQHRRKQKLAGRLVAQVEGEKERTRLPGVGAHCSPSYPHILGP